MTLSHRQLVQLMHDREVDAGRLVWQETPLGSVFHTEFNRETWSREHPPIPDVLSIVRAYPCAGRHEIRCYEVKVQRSDFRSDVRTGKYRRYLQWAHRVQFVTPRGLIQKAEIPPDAGLLEFDERSSTWRTIKLGPRCGQPAWKANDWFSLLLAGVGHERQLRRVRDCLIWRENREWEHQRRNGYQVLLGWLQRGQAAAGLPETGDYNELVREITRLRGRCRHLERQIEGQQQRLPTVSAGGVS